MNIVNKLVGLFELFDEPSYKRLSYLLVLLLKSKYCGENSDAKIE